MPGELHKRNRRKICDHTKYHHHCSECVRARRELEEAEKREYGDPLSGLLGDANRNMFVRTLLDPAAVHAENFISFVNEPALRKENMTVAAPAEEPDELREIQNELARTILRLLKENLDEWEITASKARHQPSNFTVSMDSNEPLIASLKIDSWWGLYLEKVDEDLQTEFIVKFTDAMEKAGREDELKRSRQDLENLQKHLKNKPKPYQYDNFEVTVTDDKDTKSRLGIGGTVGFSRGFPTVDITVRSAGEDLKAGAIYQFWPEGSPHPMGIPTFMNGDYLMDEKENLIKIELIPTEGDTREPEKKTRLSTKLWRHTKAFFWNFFWAIICTVAAYFICALIWPDMLEKIVHKTQTWIR